MKTEINKNDNQTIVTLDGSLNTLTSESFISEIRVILEEKQPSLIIDCKKLLYISSSGLRALLIIQTSVTRNGGQVVLKSLRPEVFKILEISGFSNILKIVE